MAARIAIGALFALWSRPILADPHTPAVLQVAVAVIAMLALSRPAYGLLAVAALVPFSQVASILWNATLIRWSDVLVGAFVLPWLAGAGSPLARRVRLDGRLLAASVLFGAVVLASCAVILIGLEGAAPSEFFGGVRVFLLQDFSRVQTRTGGLPVGAALLEGLLLFWSVVALCQLQANLPRLLVRTIVASALVAAVLSILVSMGIGLSGMLTQARMLSMRRVSGHVLDVNAAGSYFAMATCMALGMTAASRGSARASWMIASAAMGYALWLSGSRIGLAAAVVTFCFPITQLRTQWVSPALVRVATLATMVLAVAAYFALRASPLLLSGPLALRFQFVETALRMLAAYPVFGIGVGGFYLASRRFMPPELGWRYSFENAHNYYLQIAAELGILGLAIFLWLLFVAWRLSWHERTRKDPVVIGVAAGLAAFLITCLAGHPLLVHEVAYPFWITLGLFIALTHPHTEETPPYRGMLVGAAVFVILATVPFRVGAVPRDTIAYGVLDWEPDENGARVRWTRDYASIIFPSGATTVHLRLRAPHPTGIDIGVDGFQFTRVVLGSAWQAVPITLPPVAFDTPYRRLDFHIDATDASGRGVQMGEIVLSTQN